MANRVSLIKEFWQFIKENKKWWLVPVILVILILSIGIFFSGSPVAPFIYTLF